jgi:hypothetical protein
LSRRLTIPNSRLRPLISLRRVDPSDEPVAIPNLRCSRELSLAHESEGFIVVGGVQPLGAVDVSCSVELLMRVPWEGGSPWPAYIDPGENPIHTGYYAGRAIFPNASAFATLTRL